MVNYPVNLNTGVPDISIPLYTIESGGMALPIALQYHAGGFSVNEHSTRAGLGWSLSCDLQITRTINGLDDFEFRGYINNSKIKSHYTSNYNYDYPLYGPGDWQNAYRISAGEEDGMPDKFNYKLLNKSGSFYFRKDNSGTGYSIVPVPYDNIRISFENGVFTIVDTDGTTYLFGAPGYLAYGDPLSPLYREATGYTITGWKCRSITNANNTETIAFTYQDKAPEIYTSSTESIEYYSNQSQPRCWEIAHITNNEVNYAHPEGVVYYEQLLNYYAFHQLSSPKYIVNIPGKPSVFHLPFVQNMNGVLNVEDHAYPANSTYGTGGSSVYGLSLSTIEFGGGKVEFYGTDRLSTIQVKHSNNAILRYFDLYHTESSTYQPNEKATLYLDSIHFRKNDGQLFERYQLLYKNKLPFGEGVRGKDAWGYPNAFTANSDQYGVSESTVPYHEQAQRFYYDCYGFYDNVTFSIGNRMNTELGDREASQRGILSRIVYPTGGYVNFDFESHKYKELGAGGLLYFAMGGGLRIRTISYFDGTSMVPVSQKYYRYGENEDGIGIVLHGEIKLEDGETIKIVGHSQGAAFAAGIADALLNSKYGSLVEFVDYLSPHQPGDIVHPTGTAGRQFSTKSDKVSSKGLLSKAFGNSYYAKIYGAEWGIEREKYEGGLGGHMVNTWLNDLIDYWKSQGIKVTVHE